MKARKRFPLPVISVGIEVECGVSDAGLELLKSSEFANERLTIGSDLSVSVNGCSNPSVEIKFYSYFPSELFSFIKFLWTECRIKQNSTCGNHIHLKLVPFIDGLYTFYEFIDFFQNKYKERFKKNKKYIDRLSSSYSREVKSIGDLIFQIRKPYAHNARYYAINILSTWKHLKTRTLEIRVMPYAISHYEHIRQVSFVIDVVREYYQNVSALSVKSVQMEEKFILTNILEQNKSELSFEYEIFKREILENLEI